MSGWRFFIVLVAVTGVVLAAICALPHDRHQRFAALTEPATVKAEWIYERIHHDPTPIDIAFIGTSHTVFAVDSETIERGCREAGLDRCNTVNLALQHLGRDMHWLIAREVIEARSPRLLVVEIAKREPRSMHPAFYALADPADLFAAPIVFNLSYVPNLVRLPLRQIRLFARTVAPGVFGGRQGFDPILYRGAHWDDVYAEQGSIAHPTPLPRPRLRPVPVERLERQRAAGERRLANQLELPGPLRWMEQRAATIYLEKIRDLARRKNVEIRLLYLPSYNDAPPPQLADVYSTIGPMWEMPDEIVRDDGFWNDVNHLNHHGAIPFSTALGARVADALREPRSVPDVAHRAPKE